MTIDSGVKKKIDAILSQKEELKEGQKAVKDAIAGIAEELGVKPALVSKIISLVEKERAKTGYIVDEMEVLTAAGEI